MNYIFLGISKFILRRYINFKKNKPHYIIRSDINDHTDSVLLTHSKNALQKGFTENYLNSKTGLLTKQDYIYNEFINSSYLLPNQIKILKAIAIKTENPQWKWEIISFKAKVNKLYSDSNGHMIIFDHTQKKYIQTDGTFEESLRFLYNLGYISDKELDNTLFSQDNFIETIEQFSTIDKGSFLDLIDLKGNLTSASEIIQKLMSEDL